MHGVLIRSCNVLSLDPFPYHPLQVNKLEREATVQYRPDFTVQYSYRYCACVYYVDLYPWILLDKNLDKCILLCINNKSGQEIGGELSPTCIC